MEKTKAPDFTRHPQVSKEQVISKETLFKAPPPPEEENKRSPWTLLYDKVGSYYGWDFPTFYFKTPYWAIKELASVIDEKLEALDDEGKFLRWHSIDTAIGIARCLGGKDD